MPLLPLKEKPFTNVESIGGTVTFEKYYDAAKDDFFNNLKRKGLGEFVDLGTGKKVDGLFYTNNQNFVSAFSDGRLFKIDEFGAVTEITGATINTGTKVTYADFGNVGFYANNSKILKWTYSNPTCSHIADAQAPTNATFLGFLDQYLLALKANSARFDWADTANPDNWLGEFATAESRPDNAVALIAAFGEIFIPGTTTGEHWADSGNPVAPFQRITGTITERGSRSPYSVVQTDNSFFFLDSQRRVIRMAGRDPQVVSNPFDRDFQSMDVIEDAIAMDYNAEGDTKYVITFPTSKRTFAYDYKLDYWAEWSFWNEAKAIREHWIGNVGAYCSLWNKYLVGSRVDGRIYTASREFTKDGDNTVATEMWTGRNNWGTDKRKVTQKIRFKVKRGDGLNGLNPSTTPKLFISKRDNGNTAWSTEKLIDLGISGDTEFYKTFRRLGTYRDRQWRFRLTDGPLTLVSAEEDFRVLR